MERLTANALAAGRPRWSAFLELLKPITWFPPMWAFGCGIISSGASLAERWPFALAGALLAGPLVCGTSQVVNDWFDRDVDAINEPHRPIPSGRAPGQTALYFAIVWTALSVIVASFMGPWVTIAAIAGLALAWAYSAPPFRLKQNGWWGNAAVGLCYEGLPWFTAVAAVTAALPSWQILVLALLYSIGAHGIMTLNDFKAVEGDREMGIATLPIQLGTELAAKLACVVMSVPQAVVVFLLVAWGLPFYAIAIVVLMMVQFVLMFRFLERPRDLAPWYNATGTTLYVLGMMVSAVGVSSVIGGTVAG